MELGKVRQADTGSPRRFLFFVFPSISLPCVGFAAFHLPHQSPRVHLRHVKGMHGMPRGEASPRPVSPWRLVPQQDRAYMMVMSIDQYTGLQVSLQSASDRQYHLLLGRLSQAGEEDQGDRKGTSSFPTTTPPSNTDRQAHLTDGRV